MLAVRRHVQAIEQGDGLVRMSLRYQRSDQHEVLRLAREVGLVVHANPRLDNPVRGLGDIPWASRSRARCTGTGLSGPGGPGDRRAASSIAARAAS